VAHERIWAALFEPAARRGALAELRRLAHGDDAEAQWLLASWLSYSPKSGYTRARGASARWLMRSAAHGFLPAMVEAALHLEGTGSRGARVRARSLYLGAARKGSAPAAWALGLNFEASATKGRRSSAFKWFRRAALIEPEFGWKAGEHALLGLVHGRNAAEGQVLLRKAAHSGRSSEAEFYLGLRSYLGIGRTVNRRDAMAWLSRSAANPTATSTERGERCAHALLGRLLAFTPSTRRRGLQHLEIAANSGLPLAHVDLALALLASGGKWSACAAHLRSAIRAYGSQWRDAGGPWRGIERLTEERISLAHDLLGLPPWNASPG
jgi:TPR repeat protein